MSKPFVKKLNNSKKIPILGITTYPGYIIGAGRTEDIVETAIDNGYRLLECSPVYGNQRNVGESITKKIKEKVVKREDLFIITKLWITDHKPTKVIKSLKASLEELQVKYVDLFLLSWPFAHLNDYDYVDTWNAMEACLNLKLTRGIGVCNFTVMQLKRLMKYSVIKPQVNQVECHINLNQKEMRAFCKENKIAVMGYCPFGDKEAPTDGPYAFWKSSESVTLDDKKITSIANKYKKSEYQVALRFLIQLGVVTILRATSEEHIKEDINIFDFLIDKQELLEIEELDCKKRIYTAIQYRGHKYFPFKLEP